jgi:hypothetical protein
MSSTMTKERLNRVAILSIKNEILEKLEYNFIISSWKMLGVLPIGSPDVLPV